MRAKTAILFASAVYIAAWFLPSISLPDPLSASRIVVRGWGATRSALSPVWSTGLEWESPLWAALAVVSALTNVLFVTGVAVALSRHRRVPRWLSWAVGGAVLVNTHWLIPDPRFRSWLRVGYYTWLTSFVLLALALHRMQRESHSAAVPQPTA